MVQKQVVTCKKTDSKPAPGGKPAKVNGKKLQDSYFKVIAKKMRLATHVGNLILTT